MSEIWLNLGAGGNQLPAPWRNHDLDMPIDKPLPLADRSVRYVFAEHVTEHIEPAAAWRFFKEVRRVLVPRGIVRIAVPSIERVLLLADTSYLSWLRANGFGEATKESAVENLIVNHGHKALWSHDLLICCFHALGMRAEECRPNHSACGDLRGLEGHGKVIGERNNLIETIVVEATK